MPDFSLRSILPEKMDLPGVPENETRLALRELEIVNELLGGYHVILNALEQLKWDDRTYTILDLGSGGGDMLRVIARWARKKNRKIKGVGIDWNPVMTDYAQNKSKLFSNITFKTMNVFDEQLMEEKADITMNSLFCHHFDDEELIQLVKRMYRLASHAVAINDLHRHWFAYYSIKMLTKIFSKTYLVKYDGPLSVARSLKRAEWENILSASGISHYQLRWMWAWRWQIIIKKY